MVLEFTNAAPIQCAASANASQFSQCLVPNATHISSQDVLSFYSIDLSFWHYFLPLFLFIVVFRLAGYLVLRFIYGPKSGWPGIKPTFVLTMENGDYSARRFTLMYWCISSTFTLRLVQLQAADVVLCVLMWFAHFSQIHTSIYRFFVDFDLHAHCDCFFKTLLQFEEADSSLWDSTAFYVPHVWNLFILKHIIQQKLRD